MTSRTIKISEEKYRKLLEIATELQRERRQKVSFDDALGDLIYKKEKRKGDIMELAGAWSDMTDEEAKEFLNTVYKERKIVSRRFE